MKQFNVASQGTQAVPLLYYPMGQGFGQVPSVFGVFPSLQVVHFKVVPVSPHSMHVSGQLRQPVEA